MVLLSLGHFPYRNYNCILTSRSYIDGSFKFLRKSYLNRENYSIPTYKRYTMSGSMDSCFNTILGTSIKAANHAGKMVRDIMKGGDLSIVEKTGANDLQVGILNLSKGVCWVETKNDEYCHGIE